MRDAFEMWRSTRMVVLTALCAALYAALLIPFKAIVLIPGLTEVRPASALPPVLALLFGPAAAWGSALGNLIGDFFGTLTPGSLFGLLGNFLFAYVPYRVWRLLAGRREATGSLRQLPLFWLCCLLASTACALAIGYGVDLLGMAPYSVLTTIISLNNALPACILGAILLPLLYPRARRWGLLYTQNLPESDTANGPLSWLGGLLVLASSAVGVAVAATAMRAGPGAASVSLLGAAWPVKTVAGACWGGLLVGSVLLARPPRWGKRVSAVATTSAAATGTVPAEVTDLTFSYPGQDSPALTGLDLTVNPGEWVTLAGATGAGKSTLCLALSGIIPALQGGSYGGSVSIFGQNAAETPVHQLAASVGMLSQHFESQLVATDLEAEVAFALEQRGLPTAEIRARVDEALATVSLTDLVGRDPATLSGGEKQRLALAAVLATRPGLLVLDEPMTDLDPVARQRLMATLRGLCEAGQALVVVENDLWPPAGEETLCILSGGRVAGHAPAHELLRDVAACQAAGLRPLPLPDLFARVGHAERPLTLAEARQAVSGENWAVAEAARQEVQAADAARQAGHGEPLVVVSGLGHRYEGHWALRGVDLTVRRGEFVALLGPNGAGKTTLARHLNGLLRPTEGRVEVAGLDTARADVPELSRSVGYLFQDPDDQIFASKVEDEVAFGLRNRGVPEDEIASRVAEALEWMGLADEAGADPFTLTRGQRQQVALASILALRPDIIVFDEPTTGLDGQEQEQMMARLRELNRAGHTIIMITHATWAAVGYADRVVLLQDGEVLADGPPREVFADADLLARAHQVAPEVVQFSREVSGRVMLSVAEAAACLRPGGGGQ